MTKKTIAIALTVLFVLPVLCLAGEVEVGEIKLKWIKVFWNGYYLLARIPIINHTDETWGFHGKLQLLDKDGLEIRSIPIWETLRAGEKKAVEVEGRVSREDYEKTAALKLNVKVKSPSVFRRGEPPLVIERILLLPSRPKP